MKKLVSIAIVAVLCALGGMAEETLAPAPLPASTGLASPFSLQRPKGVQRSVHAVHWTVFRALEPSKPAKSAGASDEKCTRQPITLIMRYFLNP